MISGSTALKNHLKQSYSFKTSAGCTVEYNWNTMVGLQDSNVASSGYWASKPGVYPFQKLFPADSIIKGNRPNKAGIKYSITENTVINGKETIGIEGETKLYKAGALVYPKDYRLYLPGVDTSYKYWISKKDEDNQYLSISYPKNIITNKIVIKFEISHSIPAGFNIQTASADVENFDYPTTIYTGTSSNVPTFSTSSPGVLTLYYNGTSWATTESSLSLSSYATIRGIKLNLTNITGYVGVIEISPRWVKDISESVESFTVVKESSAQNEDVVPVGYVSSNSLDLALVNYNISSPQMITYSSSDAIDATKMYLNKNAELRPYIDVFHADGASGSTGNKYDRIYQGNFYIQSWSDTDTNDIRITALDGAKSLQETLCPEILCENYSMSAVIRRLLDSIGFTTYNFNYKKNGSNEITDTSVISLDYWWTEKDLTVWEAIQELCRDTQMTAVFDENGILQFYTREYLYDSSRTTVWDFRYESSGSDLANIETFDKLDIPTANQIKIIWKGTTTSQYTGDDQPLWSADNTYLAGGGLSSTLLSTDLEGSYVSITPISAQDSGIKSLLSYNGYIAINSEIIEYDAIEYKYIEKDTKIPKTVSISSQSDLLKYTGLAEPSSTSIEPTGRYRIKKRGAFGTEVVTHNHKYDSSIWTVTEIDVK